MTWQAILEAIEHNANELRITFGLGGGVGVVKYLKHMPAPYQDQIWWGSCFDTLQDLVSNGRIGERRTRSGVEVPAVPKSATVPEPVAASSAPLENPATAQSVESKPDLPVFTESK